MGNHLKLSRRSILKEAALVAGATWRRPYFQARKCLRKSLQRSDEVRITPTETSSAATAPNSFPATTAKSLKE
jgi:hypothetical protein